MTGRMGLLGGKTAGRLVGAMLTDIDGVGRLTLENKELPELPPMEEQSPFAHDDPAGHLEHAFPI